MDLVKGQNAPIPADVTDVSVAVTVVSGPPPSALDVSALLVGADGRVLADEAFVFYNQPTSPDRSVRLDAAARRLEIALGAVDDACARLVFVVSVDAEQAPDSRIAQFSGLAAVVSNAADGGQIFSFSPSELTSESALVLGELYRRNGAWRFRAIGQGYDNGLGGIAIDFGVAVGEPEQPSATPVAETQPHAARPGDAAAPSPEPSAPGAASSPIAYSRPDTSASTAAPAPSAPEPSPAPTPVAPAPEPAATGPVTLWAAAGVWNRTQDVGAEVLQAYFDAVQRAKDAMAAAETSMTETFTLADNAASDLKKTFKDMYGEALNGSGKSEGPTGNLQDWTRRVEALSDEIASTRVPITRANRDKQRWAFAAKANALLSSQPQAEVTSLQEHYLTSSSAAASAFRSTLASAQSELAAIIAKTPVLPAVVGSLEMADVIGQPPVPGAGPLLVRVGSIRPGPFEVTGRAPSTGYNLETPDKPTWEASAPWSIPALLDFTTVNGVVTTSVATVNNILLKLVSLLPAGQLKMTLFDPVKLGDNAKFIFGLGDAAEQIIGDKVRSTDRELADILVGLEEHLGFVTQKYLQGQYESLSDYNEAAGEVAEPYRALVLYDFPNGFVRAGGSPDEEMLARLAKIIGSGKRCGVMTFVVRQSADFSPNSPVSNLYPLFPTVEMSHWLARNLASGIPSNVEPGQLLATNASWSPEQLPKAARKAGATLWRAKVEGSYRFEPDPEPAPEVVAELLAGVERGLTHAADVRVSLEQVAQLASSKLERDVAKGTRLPEQMPLPSDERTWWHGSAGDGIAGTFGRVGANDLGALELDSQIASGALIGGRMGSGKSVLLHAIILSLVTRYSPEELSLYLIDFKEGVEFKAYAAEALPHARVVAVESEREFGLSVLQSLDSEITRRGALFRASDGQELNLSQYRARSGDTLPRIVLLVDEFHVLFNQDDKIAGASADLLDRIVRQGRAFGVHVILASQTLSGAAAVNKTTLGLIPIRIALQSSEADSRVLLADDNPDARLLTRPGEGLLNTKGGLRDANSRFQAAYTSPDDRIRMLRQLRSLADSRGMSQRPVVFEGREPADVSELPAAAFGAAHARSGVAVPVGMPLTLDDPVKADLRREPGGNLLLVMADETAYGPLVVAMGSLLRSGARVRLLDYGSLDAPWEQQLSELADAGIDVLRRSSASSALDEARRLVEERHALNDLTAPPLVLVLSSLHRAREFDTSAADGPEPDDLAHILREGPDVGVHVIAWCDKPVSVGRRLTSSMLREFSLRLLGPMGKDDSFSLIDSDAASTLNSSQVVLDDHDRVVTVRARRFDLPRPVALAQRTRV